MNPLQNWVRLGVIGLSCLLIQACDEYSKNHLGFTKLEQIKHDGKLVVLTRLDPTSYYIGPEGVTGLEFDLVNLFAESLGVQVEFLLPDNFDTLLQMIANNKADIAAAGLTITPDRQEILRFSPPYQNITEQVIYKTGRKRPKNAADLSAGILEITKGTTYESTLQGLKQQYPPLEWLVNDNLDSDSLMYLVNKELIDYTIADSQQASIIRSYYPKLGVAFELGQPKQLAWALYKSNDDSLYQEVAAFFKRIKENKTLAKLLEKHYGHANRLNYVGNCTFRKHIKERLPAYKEIFKAAAKRFQLDWRLIAAIGYQESHWNPDATSPTGVKGIMMLTRGTAKQLQVKDRTNPKQSIFGGAKYFKQRLEKIPKRVTAPDRTWFALASYNVGLGHLEDARVLTQQRGKNPDRWLDVKESLPLLTKKKWYSKTKHGYARGWEPVHYVENIRSYYHLLTFLTADDLIKRSTMQTINKKETVKNSALEINSPAL